MAITWRTGLPPQADRAVNRRRLAFLALAVVGLLLMRPVLVEVYRRIPAVVHLGPGWLVAIGVMVTLHFVTAWELYRVVLRTKSWFDVVTSHLASNAASHVTPAGSAVGAGMQLRMLVTAGYPASRAATVLGATTLLSTVAGYIVLPLVVLVGTMLGTTVHPRVVVVLWYGSAALGALLVAVVAFAVRDAPWRWAARVATTVQRRLGRAGDHEELARRMIEERDLMRAALQRRVGLVGLLVLAQPLADFAALYLALRAAGVHVRPTVALAAFIASNVAGMIPLTPGGLGFVEAGLTGVFSLAGAPTANTALAVATYRLAATWLPSIAGAVALVLFQQRHGRIAEPRLRSSTG
jgi:uncharacterized protein (TIRG00374 family)